MKFTRTTAPSATPISVDEAKAHSIIEHAADDAIVGNCIAGAVDFAENYTGRQLMPQVWTQYHDCWPTCFELPFRPLQSVVITYDDENGDAQALADDQYQVDSQAYPAMIRPAPGASWPALDNNYNVVRVAVSCGYTDADSVPAGIKSALYMLTAHLYENREASAPIDIREVPLGVPSFLDQYRIDFL